jgi:hypothetical protein
LVRNSDDLFTAREASGLVIAVAYRRSYLLLE